VPMKNPNIVTLTKEYLAHLIESKFSLTHAPHITKVVQKDGVIHYGYFQQFDDFNTLKEHFNYRFIPIQNAVLFSEENLSTGMLNKKYSIIINASDIESIEEETQRGVTG
jgi:hypothetical protein